MFLWLLACEYGLTLPSTEAGPEGPLIASQTTKARERVTILPQDERAPPPPVEAGIYASQCGDLTDGGAVGLSNCLTAEIHCGETIVGHTVGGVQRISSRWMASSFCVPDVVAHDKGHERMYLLRTPDHDQTATITLDTPCTDLDVFAFPFPRAECPNGDTIVSRCEMFPEDGTAREQIEVVTQSPGDWFIVVDGKSNNEGAFSLSVQCRDTVR
jgi:hypothetical protein